MQEMGCLLHDDKKVMNAMEKINKTALIVRKIDGSKVQSSLLPLWLRLRQRQVSGHDNPLEPI